ncbi:MAG TPA: hypothetical protein VGI84_04025 [Pseudonocardiaceae bacterium]
MVDITAGLAESGAPARELLTVAELTSRLSADKRARRTATSRAARGSDGPVTVEDLLRREGRPDRTAGRAATSAAQAGPASPVAPRARRGGAPVAAPPPIFRNVQPVRDVPFPVPMPESPQPDPCAMPLAQTAAVRGIGPAGMPGPGQPPTAPLMLPSVGPRAARSRPSMRRPLVFGVAVAGAALFVGGVATSAPLDRPLGPSDMVPFADPTLPAAAASGDTVGSAAAPAAPEITPLGEALPLSPPPIGQRALPLSPGVGSAQTISRPEVAARSIPSAPASTGSAPAQTAVAGGRTAPADPGAGQAQNSSQSGSSTGSGSTGGGTRSGSTDGGSTGTGSTAGGATNDRSGTGGHHDSADSSPSGSGGHARTYSASPRTAKTDRSGKSDGAASTSADKHAGGSGGRHHR